MLPDHQQIRAQLEAILESDGFARSRRMQRFLRFVVEETLAGSADQLGEYSVGLAVFDRGVDFEPALDPIVRNEARRLRVKLLEYYSRAAGAGTVLIEMPKGGYVPTFRTMPASVGEADPREPNQVIRGNVTQTEGLCRVVINFFQPGHPVPVGVWEFDLDLAQPVALGPKLLPVRLAPAA